MNLNSKVSPAMVASWLNRIESDRDDRETWLKLWNLGPQNSDAVPQLMARLRDPQSTIQGAAARFLGLIGEAAREALPELIDAIRNGDCELRHSALIAIGEIGFTTSEVEELLKRLLDSSDEFDRIYSAAALLRHRPPNTETLEVLRQARQSSNYVVRGWAASLVTGLIPRIPDAIGVAIEFLDDEDVETVEDTSRGLARNDPAIIVPLLLQHLRRENSTLRFGVLSAIREFAAHANWMSSEIIKSFLETDVFNDDDLDVRRCAANVAQFVSLNCPIVVEELRFLLGDPSDWVAEQAANALLSFGEIPIDVRREAEDALAFIESPPERRGFPPSIPETELESLSAQDLMPDPDFQLRRVRKMPDRE